MAESEELKSLLMKVKEESEKVDLKLIIQKTKIVRKLISHHFMANRWGNNGNSDQLYFLGSKITANCDSSHEIKRHLLLGRKVVINLAAAAAGAKSLQSCPTPSDPWPAAYQGPLSMGFARQE